MYHDFLFALLGHPGDIFYPRIEDGHWATNPSFTLFHPSERHLIDEILRDLSANYALLFSFANSRIKSVYISAFQQALLKHVIEPYQSAIAELEMFIVKNASGFKRAESDALTVPIAYFSSKLSNFRLLIPHIAEFVRKNGLNSDNERIIGQSIAIIDSLHEVLQTTGLPPIRQVFFKITSEMRMLIYRQLVAWTCFGKILDPHSEF